MASCKDPFLTGTNHCGLSGQNSDKIQNSFCSLISFLGHRPVKMPISTTRSFIHSCKSILKDARHIF